MAVNNYYSVNFEKSEITLSERFTKRLQRCDTQAEAKLANLRHLYPEHSFKFPHVKKNNAKNPTYEQMEEILEKSGHADLIPIITEARNAAPIVDSEGRTIRQNSYFTVRKRFGKLCEEHGINQRVETGTPTDEDTLPDENIPQNEDTPPNHAA